VSDGTLDSDSRAWFRLTPEDRAALTDAGYSRTWRSGETLASQGAPPGSTYVIRSGWVKISATNDRGDNAPLALRGPGEIVGELAPISDRPRNATIRAITDVTALVIPRDRLLDVLSRRPRITHALIHASAVRLEQSDRLRLETGHPDFPQRLAAVLLELANQVDPTLQSSPVDLPFTQDDLAALARVSRSTLIRGLDKLRATGAVTTARGHVRIADPQALHDFAGKSPN
jgi:CRP/FNR family transcriptional regulator, cyclic AMP receptor protein